MDEKYSLVKKEEGEGNRKGHTARERERELDIKKGPKKKRGINSETEIQNKEGRRGIKAKKRKK